MIQAEALQNLAQVSAPASSEAATESTHASEISEPGLSPNDAKVTSPQLNSTDPRAKRDCEYNSCNVKIGIDLLALAGLFAG